MHAVQKKLPSETCCMMRVEGRCMSKNRCLQFHLVTSHHAVRARPFYGRGQNTAGGEGLVTTVICSILCRTLVVVHSMPDDADVFDMDSDQASSVSARSRVDTHAQATTSSHGAPGVEGPAGDRYGSIDMCRRAIPVIEADEDICSICLDEFTQEDPGNCTVCGCAS